MARKQNTKNDLILSAGASPAPARRKTAPRTRPERTAAPQEATSETLSEHQPSYDEIAQLAYSYWEARGCQGGSPEEDWLRAETELRARTSSATVTAIA